MPPPAAQHVREARGCGCTGRWSDLPSTTDRPDLHAQLYQLLPYPSELDELVAATSHVIALPVEPHHKQQADRQDGSSARRYRSVDAAIARLARASSDGRRRDRGRASTVRPSQISRSRRAGQSIAPQEGLQESLAGGRSARQRIVNDRAACLPGLASTTASLPVLSDRPAAGVSATKFLIDESTNEALAGLGVAFDSADLEPRPIERAASARAAAQAPRCGKRSIPAAAHVSELRCSRPPGGDPQPDATRPRARPR